MNPKKFDKRYWYPLLLVFLILVIDQVIKIVVKTNMFLGEEIPVFGNWFIIHFTENEGMALGMSFAGKYGKLVLSLLRLVAIGLIAWYVYSLIKKKEKPIIIYSLTFILAGAIGNVIDCCFYGLIFSESGYFLGGIAEFMPQGGGYTTFLHGKVVDMFYMPMFEIHMPNAIPLIGGQIIRVFSFIFNFADFSVTVGVVMLLIYTIFLSKSKTPKELGVK